MTAVQVCVRTGGIILCGGESSRMGRAKAWLPFGAETLLARTVRVVQEVVQPLVVVAAAGQELPPLPPEIQIVYDRHAGCGPLAGLAIGLQSLADRVSTVFVAACDLPLLKVEFVRQMVAWNDGPQQATIPRPGGIPQPLAGIYSTQLWPSLNARIESGQLSIRDFLATIETRWLDEEVLRAADPELVSLININRPADYQAALSQAGFASDSNA